MLLSVHAGMLAWGAWHLSPTCLEVAHLPSGISHWKFGRYELYCVNPPLVRMVAALPVLAAGCRLNWGRYETGPGKRPEYFVGRDFVTVNGERTLLLVTLARWLCIPFSLIGGYVCYRWAREIYGSPSGLLALVLWCTSPEVLAHGMLITPDAAASALGVAAAYGFWRWLQAPDSSRAIIAGLLLGLAELSKMSWLFLFALWPALWGAKRERGPAFQLAIILIVALYVLNLGYGFSGSFRRLGDYRFVSATLSGVAIAEGHPSHIIVGNRFVGSWVEALPIPLPKDYVTGLDLQKRDFESFSLPSYLRGVMRNRGWWYYYLYGLGVKVPLGTWLISVYTVLWRFWPRVRTPRPSGGSVLLVPPAVLFALVSSQTTFSLHFRYVMPVFPFAFVWMSQIAEPIRSGPQLIRWPVLASLSWLIAGSLWVFPHSLSYFNELAGGPYEGHNHMIVSSIDWGQDLSDLRHWMVTHPEARPMRLAYYGGFDPASVGFDCPPPDCEGSGDCVPRAGWYAVSVNLLRGLPHGGYREGTFRSFLRYRPVAIAGYSIYIYHITSSDVRL